MLLNGRKARLPETSTLKKEFSGRKMDFLVRQLLEVRNPLNKDTN